MERGGGKGISYFITTNAGLKEQKGGIFLTVVYDFTICVLSKLKSAPIFLIPELKFCSNFAKISLRFQLLTRK